MHAGMKHCLAAAAVNRRQKSAKKADVGRVLSRYIKRTAEETG